MNYQNIQIDPITVEVIQNRLTQIGREAGIILTKTAASPVVVEAKDLGFNIADHLGRAIVYSVWMPRHGTTLSYMLRSCIKKFQGNINPGDMFMTNNPHAGALHIGDIAVIAPVFYEQEIISWVGCATHHLDIGGMTAGWCPEATDWYQEGIKFSPVKLVVGGKLQEDIFDIFLDNVRVPDYQAHDLKAQIAANNFAINKITELVNRYGFDTLKACYEEIINFTEEKTRQRIKMIPDGKYEFTDYMDYGEIHTIKCTLEVKEDCMTLDFIGTSPQAKTAINAALACSVANIHNIYTCMLIPDISANEGCFLPFEINIPPGTVLSCLPPAPCSAASIQGGWKAQCMAIGVFSKALAASPELKRLVNASWGSGHGTTQISGVNQFQRRYTLLVMEGCMQGGGARATKDGIDASNIAGSTSTSIPNVEAIEQKFPFLYLYRRYRKDSEGAGEFRGGLAGEYALKPYGVENFELLGFYIGKIIPALGVFGGYPGATTVLKMKRNTDINEYIKKGRVEFEWLRGDEIEFPSSNPPIKFIDTDVFLNCSQGGGGYGDPIKRNPELVLKDIKAQFITLEKAKNVYGVVIDNNEELNINWRIDNFATEMQREIINKNRVESTELTKQKASLTLENCKVCGNSIDQTIAADFKVDNSYTPIQKDNRVSYFQLLCPHCMSSLDVGLEYKEI